MGIFLWLALAAALATCVVFFVLLLKANKESTRAQAKLSALLRYENIPNAEAYIADLKRHAEAEAGRMLDDAKSRLESAQTEADRLLGEAKAEAERVAGEALEAKDKHDLYKSGAEAMKNLMEGYGDEFLVPHVFLLEELSDEVDHTEAGQKLKEAMAASKALAKSGKAAACDYVRADRRDYAIRFVLDAFNGKAEGIIADVKHNNYGKLEKRLEDAFAIVNVNGRGFRNARVEREYLEARREELKWAVRAMELKKQEKEEQRLIKEQMREEERARREYEKAIKQAEKEQRAVAKALHAAQKAYEAAAEEQKRELEAQIAELTKNLSEAEQANQRAISMAQQTKRGHVYIISNEGSFGEHVYKVGMTRRLEPNDRIRELGDASVPFPFDVHAMIYSDDAPALEAELHRCLDEKRMNHVNRRKEFFMVRLARIRQRCEELGVDVHWTMKAEATEYHESKAMHKLSTMPPAMPEPAAALIEN